jgi:transposase
VTANPLLPAVLWERIEPLLPPPPTPKRPDRPGRKRVPDRRSLIGILFVLKTGIDWEDLPCELGCGRGMTCWRRLAYWTANGVWPWLHALLLAELHEDDRIDWSRTAIDTAHAWARGGGQRTGTSPVNRGKRGSKHIVVVDGSPLAMATAAANQQDVKELLPDVDAVPPVRGKPGRLRRRPHRLCAARGFDSDAHRQASRRRRIRPLIARQNTPHGSGLGVFRWIVERTLS